MGAIYTPPIQPSRSGRYAMDYFVGLDVGVRTTSICVMNEAGAVVREGKVESSPEEIIGFLVF